MSVFFRAARRRRPRSLTASFAAAMVAASGLFGVYGSATASAATAAVPAPAAAWPLNDGSGTSAADSVGTNAAAFDDAAAVSWATTGQTSSTGLNFTGTSGSCAHAPAPAVDTSQSFTVSAWVKFNGLGGFQTITGINGTSIGGLYLQLSGVTGTLAFTRRDSDSTGAGYALADSGIQPATGTWYHIVGVDDTATSTLKIYVDGSEGTDAAYGSPWQAQGATSIGCGLWAGSPTDYVNGEVDDVQYYSSALTTAQVQNIDAAARWTFAEGSGTSTADTTGNGQTLALGAGASWVKPGAVDANALSFNGTQTSDAAAGAPVVDTSQSFSVGGWIRLNSTGGYQDLATISGNSVSAFFLQLRGDGRFAFTRLGADSTGAPTFTAESQSPAQAGAWYYLTGVYDLATNSISLYVNGQLQSTVAVPSGDGWKGSGDFLVGQGLYGGNPVDFLNGEVDDISVYQYPLTATEVSNITAGAGVNLSVDASAQLHSVPGDFFGLMTEDINHSMTGGLYAELINNRSMMASNTAPVDWDTVGDTQIALDAANPLNSALTQSLKVNIADASSSDPAGVANRGYWGIPVRPDYTYRATIFAKASAGFTGDLKLAIQSSDGSETYASTQIGPLGTGWKKYTAVLHTSAAAPVTADARYAVMTSNPADNGQTVWLDYVSLFPPTYDNLHNGLRVDLMQKFAKLDPSFIRLPGGNYLEGNTIATRFDWQSTIGVPWQRPGHMDDAWGYWSTDGMGILEYAEWAEELHAQPLLAVYAGYSLDGAVVPQDQMQPYVTSAIDEIHYLTDAATTSWGAMRAADGHPAPFTINDVEVGNEDFFDRSGSYQSYRWPMFYNAIHQAFPNIKLIATTSVGSGPQPYAIDDHYYQSAAWMNDSTGLFNSTSRTGPKVFVGEWATQEGNPTPDLNAAIGDASWLTGLIRNSDVVMGESYAPGLVNVNNVAWPTNLIGFDASSSYVSPSYWVQEMLAQNHGNEVIGSSTTGYQGVNTVATEDTSTGEVYVTLVNPAQSTESVNVTLSGLSQVSSNGRAIVLSGSSGNETNTLSDPNQLVPQTSPITGLAPQFSWTIPAHSVTILELNVPTTTTTTTTATAAKKSRYVYRCARVLRKGHRRVLCARLRSRPSDTTKRARPRSCVRNTRAAARRCATPVAGRHRRPSSRS